MADPRTPSVAPLARWLHECIVHAAATHADCGECDCADDTAPVWLVDECDCDCHA